MVTLLISKMLTQNTEAGSLIRDWVSSQRRLLSGRKEAEYSLHFYILIQMDLSLGRSEEAYFTRARLVLPSWSLWPCVSLESSDQKAIPLPRCTGGETEAWTAKGDGQYLRGRFAVRTRGLRMKCVSPPPKLFCLRMVQ